jgi:hypothetical protein
MATITRQCQKPRFSTLTKQRSEEDFTLFSSKTTTGFILNAINLVNYNDSNHKTTFIILKHTAHRCYRFQTLRGRFFLYTALV